MKKLIVLIAVLLLAFTFTGQNKVTAGEGWFRFARYSERNTCLFYVEGKSVNALSPGNAVYFDCRINNGDYPGTGADVFYGSFD